MRQHGFHLDTSLGTFRDVWKGIRRAHGQPPVKKSALLTLLLRRALATLPETLPGVRDRALLLVGFAGALRRSELAAVEVSNRPGSNFVRHRLRNVMIVFHNPAHYTKRENVLVSSCSLGRYYWYFSLLRHFSLLSPEQGALLKAHSEINTSV